MSMSSPVKDFLMVEGEDHGFLYGFFFFWYMRLFNNHFERESIGRFPFLLRAGKRIPETFCRK